MRATGIIYSEPAAPRSGRRCRSSRAAVAHFGHEPACPRLRSRRRDVRSLSQPHFGPLVASMEERT